MKLLLSVLSLLGWSNTNQLWSPQCVILASRFKTHSAGLKPLWLGGDVAKGHSHPLSDSLIAVKRHLDLQGLG